MGFDEPQVIDDGDGGGAESLSTSNVSCSICLEIVTDNGDRSWAKLQCGHEFHLDCIGSAFNIKGAMQCPNCRKIEKGQWLFATGCRSIPDVSFEDWPHDEDLYDLSYSEMQSFGVQWCPITPFPRLPSSFEEGEFPSTAYHDLLGQHAIFAEHTAVPSSTHPCPYVAYYGPIHSSSSSPVGSMSDGSNYCGHWGGPSASSEMPTFSFAPMDPNYQSWEHHSLPFSATASRLVGPDQPSFQSMTQRSSRANSDLARAGSLIHPFLASHSSGTRVAGSPTSSSMVPPYPGSAARAHDRAQALQAYFQPPNTSPPMGVASSRRSNSHRGPHQVAPLPSLSDQAGGFYVFPSGTSNRNFPDVENPMNNRFYTWERDHPVNFPRVERDCTWGGWSGSSSFRQQH